MKITIVTPSYQRPDYLDQTISSVLTQAGDFDLEYIVHDGGSNQEVIDILKLWDEKVNKCSFNRACRNLSFKWYSEADNGMYQAINRGFAKGSGEVMAWINSDDFYHSGALSAVAEIFRKFPDVNWITGIPNSFNSTGTTVGYDSFPNAYSREFIKQGYYNVNYLNYGFNWIAQDCCFWRRSLWLESGGQLNEDKKLAADFNLWQSFAQHADLVKCLTFLGGYRFHGEQFTADPENYFNELPKTDPPPDSLKILNRIFQQLPISKRAIFNRYQGFPWLKFLKLDWDDLTGRVIHWDFAQKTWKISLREIF